MNQTEEKEQRRGKAPLPPRIIEKGKNEKEVKSEEESHLRETHAGNVHSAASLKKNVSATSS